MVVSIKNKIRAGTLFLFFLLVLSGAVSIYSLVGLKTASTNIIKDNYESLVYCHGMQNQLDSIPWNHAVAVGKFESYLAKEEDNITEAGEREATQKVRLAFKFLVAGDTSQSTYNGIKSQLQSILLANMNAIDRKNKLAQQSAERASTLVVLIVALTLVIGLSFTYNFPAIVVTPIHKLTEAVQQIGRKNYSHRIHLDTKDEFGQLADAVNEMTERLEEFESSNLHKLMFEKARAEAVINSLKDASIGIDKNNVILFANFQALQLLGLRAEEVVAKSVDEVKTKNDLLGFLIDKDSSAPFKIVVDNRENYFVKEMIEVGQGDTRNKVIVLKNITSYKELDVAKTNFISTISHELKTPLASSDFSLKLLSDERVGQLSPEQKELIENLKDDNSRMLKILSELLNMSQVESGKIQLNIAPVRPFQIIGDAIQAVITKAKEKEIRIVNNASEALPALMADADKATWVLNNLLTNAIKYSYNNSSVVIDAVEQNGQVLFSVTDEGPGIDKIFIPRLFERFFQVPGSKEKGTGLGLAISKEFVEAQGGTIWATSEIGKGSIFSFVLPIK